MKPTITITGTDEIARKIRAMGKALTRQTLIPIMADNVEPIADNMRSLARRRTGAMAESVTVSTKLSPHQAAIVEPIAPIEIYAGPGPLPQAIQEEFGNVHEPPHPFIRPQAVRGCLYELFVGAVDATYQTVIGFKKLWVGRLDSYDIVDAGETITVTAGGESRMRDQRRPAIKRFTDWWQQRRYPGDRAFEYVARMVEVPVLWAKARQDPVL